MDLGEFFKELLNDAIDTGIGNLFGPSDSGGPASSVGDNTPNLLGMTTDDVIEDEPPLGQITKSDDIAGRLLAGVGINAEAEKDEPSGIKLKMDFNRDTVETSGMAEALAANTARMNNRILAKLLSGQDFEPGDFVP